MKYQVCCQCCVFVPGWGRCSCDYVSGVGRLTGWGPCAAPWSAGTWVPVVPLTLQVWYEDMWWA